MVCSITRTSSQTSCLVMYCKVPPHLGAHVVQARVVVLVDLGESGETGTDPVAEAILGDVLAQARHDARAFGARADDVHVAAHDVPELR